MFGNLFFVLTVISYLALIILNFQNFNIKGEYLIGYGFLALTILALYGIFSLVLTINVAKINGLDWLLPYISSRNVAIGILWFGLMAGVFISTMIRPEWHTDPTTGLVRGLLAPFYFGCSWLPILMLVPYAVLLNPEWRNTLNSNFYKIPLIIGWLLGLLLIIAPKMIMTFPQEEQPETISTSIINFLTGTKNSFM